MGRSSCAAVLLAVPSGERSEALLGALLGESLSMAIVGGRGS
jgi:hypothetical protein